MRQPPGKKQKTVAGIVAVLCLLILIGEFIVFLITPVSTISRLAREEEMQILSMRGLSSNTKAKFIRTVRSHFAHADKWFRIAETEKKLEQVLAEEKIREKEKNKRSEDPSKALIKEIDSIPVQLYSRLANPESITKTLNKIGWAVSLCCLRWAVIRMSGVLWLTFPLIVGLVAHLKQRRQTSVSVFTFGLSRGATFIFFCTIPVAYSFSSIRFPASFFLCGWVGLTCGALYLMVKNIPLKGL